MDNQNLIDNQYQNIPQPQPVYQQNPNYLPPANYPPPNYPPPIPPQNLPVPPPPQFVIFGQTYKFDLIKIDQL